MWIPCGSRIKQYTQWFSGILMFLAPCLFLKPSENHVGNSLSISLTRHPRDHAKFQELITKVLRKHCYHQRKRIGRPPSIVTHGIGWVITHIGSLRGKTGCKRVSGQQIWQCCQHRKIEMKGIPWFMGSCREAFPNPNPWIYIYIYISLICSILELSKDLLVI